MKQGKKVAACLEITSSNYGAHVWADGKSPTQRICAKCGFRFDVFELRAGRVKIPICKPE